MEWLIARQLRPFVLLAGAGSQNVIDLPGICAVHDFAWVLAHASDVDVVRSIPTTSS